MRYLLVAVFLVVSVTTGCGKEGTPPHSGPQAKAGPDGTGAWGEAGARDPLVEKSKTEAYRERIVERMRDVQTDR